MEFCDKCGSIMMPGGAQMSCPRCGHKKKGKVNLKISEEVKHAGEIVFIDKKKESANPITDYPCKKCGNKRAFFWIQQMRAGDEPESKFYKCTKCENTVREDS